MDKELTVDDLRRMLANPFYCIEIHPSMAVTHEPLITEDVWIAGAVNSIKEIGADAFLKELLENLKGNCV